MSVLRPAIVNHMGGVSEGPLSPFFVFGAAGTFGTAGTLGTGGVTTGRGGV